MEPTWRYGVIVRSHDQPDDIERHLFTTWTSTILDVYASLCRRYPDSGTYDVFVWDYTSSDIAEW